MVSVSRPADLARSLVSHRWVLFDVALALGLVVATLQQYTFSAPKVWWWVFAAPMVAGLLIRRRWPLAAFVLAGVGATLHHLDAKVELELLDLAAPLTLYTLASGGRSRRTAAVALGAAVVCVGLLSMLHVVDASSTAEPGTSTNVDPRLLKEPGNFADPGEFAGADAIRRAKNGAGTNVNSPPTASDLLSAAIGQGLGVMLVLGLAVAVGDGVRSRRAHLRSVEERAADLEREQRQRVALATAAERARITRELHDVVAHGLSVIVVQAQGGAAALEHHPDRTAEALRNVIITGRDSLFEMRRLLDLVRRDPGDDANLSPPLGVGSLPDLVDRVRAAGTPVTFAIDGEPVPVPTSVDLSAYRIAQEALTNTIKHAGAGARAAVRLDFQPDRLEIEVSDDGVGGPVPPDGDGTGLRGIAERVGLLGGELTAGPVASGGFRVHARLPLEPAGAPT